MSGLLDNKDHPLLEYSMEERKAYLCVVASIASADQNVSDDEISKIRSLCKKVKLDAPSMGQVITAAEDPGSSPVKLYLNQMLESDLRYTLITDMLFLAYADKHYSSHEKNVVAEIALQLKVNSEQLQAMENYVIAVIDYQSGGISKTELKRLGGNVAAGMAAAGVPVAAVAISGTVLGLSSAGILSGLLALGLGLGMATGVGVVAVIGVASYFGVKWLYQQLMEEEDE